jgi:hypothetical protein
LGPRQPAYRESNRRWRQEHEVGLVFQVDHLIGNLVHGPDQLVQFQIDRARIAILSVLVASQEQWRTLDRDRTGGIQLGNVVIN